MVVNSLCSYKYGCKMCASICMSMVVCEKNIHSVLDKSLKVCFHLMFMVIGLVR